LYISFSIDTLRFKSVGEIYPRHLYLHISGTYRIFYMKQFTTAPVFLWWRCPSVWQLHCCWSRHVCQFYHNIPQKDQFYTQTQTKNALSGSAHKTLS